MSLCSFPLPSVASYLGFSSQLRSTRSRLFAGLTWCQHHFELQIQEVNSGGDQRDGGQVAGKESVSYFTKQETQQRLAIASPTQPGERRQRLPRINNSFAHKRCYAMATTVIGVIGKYKEGEGIWGAGGVLQLVVKDQIKVTKQNSTPWVTFKGYDPRLTVSAAHCLGGLCRQASFSDPLLPLPPTTCLSLEMSHFSEVTHVLLTRQLSATHAGTLSDFHRSLLQPRF